MPGWDGFPIRAAFADEYEAPVFVDNDVNVMALGEHRDGLGKGEDDVLFVKIGTHRWRHHCGRASTTWQPGVRRGHRTFVWTRTGLSARAVIRMPRSDGRCSGHRRQGEAVRGGRSLPVLREVFEERGALTARDVGEAASFGDYHALQIIRESGRLVGQVLATLVSTLNPSSS